MVGPDLEGSQENMAVKEKTERHQRWNKKLLEM